MRIMLTGAAGFVGSHVLRHLLHNTDAEIVCPVTFRHKGIPPRLWAALDGSQEHKSRVYTAMMDLTAPIDQVTRSMLGQVDVIMNVASESHVDRSITDPGPFIENNVRLMANVLDYARAVKPSMVLHMSTDEVYGPAYGTHRHTEWETVRPSNPYSASKAAQEAIAFSYWRTYGVPVVITNTMNIIGETQDAEKMVPRTIQRLRDGRPVTVHTAKDGTPGSRFYLHARNLADAWLYLMSKHLPQSYSHGHTEPSRFHIVGEREVTNTELVKMIANMMGTTAEIRPESVHATRPGHDLRYALDGSKLAAAGWKAPVPFEDSLERTVRWSLDNPAWLA